MERLSIRLKLLEKYTASEKLDREVVEKVVTNVEADVAVVEKNVTHLSEENQQKAYYLFKKAKAELRTVRMKLKKGHE